MTWAPLLLADRSASLRYLVLTELLGKTGQEEANELDTLRKEDPIVKSLLALQGEGGKWKQIDQAGFTIGGAVRGTSAALMRLGYLGFTTSHPAVKRGTEYLFSKQRRDGSWPLPERVSDFEFTSGPYTMTPVQTSVPLLALAMCGLAEDPRAERGYDWLMEAKLEDGTWPAGKVHEVFVRIAGYRRLPHSEWGCRTNTTQALLCLAYHAKRAKGSEARQALDHLLARETRDRGNLGFNVARYLGFEPFRGALTYHARFDPALVLSLCSQVGAYRSDSRVEGLIQWLVEQQGPYGLWDYEPNPEATRWVTFEILRSLRGIDDGADWFSTKKRTTFRAYPKKGRRF
jgi:hypothetical protein